MSAPAILDPRKACGFCGADFTPTERRLLYCSKSCSGRACSDRRRRPLADRFWEKVDRSGGADACWLWTGHRNRKGYGKLQRGGRGSPDSAHRIAYELQLGSIPDGQQVLHRCDTPPCCNGSHLFLGDNSENVADKVAKGRQARGPAVAVFGERHGMAKLSEDQVREIRRLGAEGCRQADIAERFRIAENNISRILARKAWGHVL